ncbi:putative uncharacterized transposon-derived protein F54H12.3 [Trichonephila clavipes]|nr:putative uncharacterized transposon-derived protein F54H12.3 [Trichonephila clavipes]GFX00108.1 putative uncharacterized transposon-derived protein F54H12.3 [Trichonephila clavipes]
MEWKNIYRVPEHAGSFGGIDAVHRSLKGKVSRKDIKNWLQTKESYTLHKPVRKKIDTNRVIVGRINQQFQADLVDMQSLSSFNDGYKYLLTCIDVLSKYAWAMPLKNKKSESIVSAFKKIFSERIPKKLQTDAGKEFVNVVFQKYLKKMKVGFFTTNNKAKASIVERFNRTLKTKMWKYFTEMNTKCYIDVLGKLVYSYNHTWHRSIRMEPSSVSEGNQTQVWLTLYGQSLKESKSIFKVGDTVRISREKLNFEKGYTQNWTREIFTIHQILSRNPIVYRVKDLSGEIIQGTFYPQELQKVSDSGFYPVEKVIRTRKRNGKSEYLVKFQGYPDKFNAWVSDVRMI